tara:strand:- start:63085 stop:64596 length:1512 start_codon:yes stop_codon:yes gene_type:complete
MGFATHLIALAWQALMRNKAQTLLAMLGVTVGVGALVTSMALGRGAQEAIKDQLLAAGANMIIVNSGNYQTERAGAGGSPADHGYVPSPKPQRTPYLVKGPIPGFPNVRLLNAHFEDDPMAEHDHPLASDRLGDNMAGLGAAATLTLDDADAIRNEIPGIDFVASGVHENARISLKSDPTKQWFTRLHGTESDLPVIRSGWIFPYGRFLSASQVRDAEQTMVIGRVVADRLFGEGINPVGETIVLWNQDFRVIGVVDSTSWAAQPSAGDDQFDAIYIPVTTVHSLLNLSKLNTITITTESAGETTRISKQIEEILRRRHGITEQMPDDFTVKTQAQQLLGKGLSPDVARIVAGNLESIDALTIEQLSASLQRANRTMLALLAGVATVSLLVGGIGVMNLLLLSVTQRTREVGLRMAMGARGSDIASQFVLEAIVLSVVGGLIGAACGVLVAESLEQVFQWSTDVSVISMVFAIIVAAVLGIVSSVYPAHRASQLNPIGALHHE